MTPTLVVNDYFKRQASGEFYEVIKRPEMHYLRPAMRDNWVNHNALRRMPDVVLPMQFAIWRRWNDLLERLTLNRSCGKSWHG